MNYEYWSIVPSLVAIVLALRTKQVYLSLLLGLWVGELILRQGNVWWATYDTLGACIAVFEDAGNTRTIAFTLLVGALIALIQRSGGVESFVSRLQRYLAQKKESAPAHRKRVQLFAVLTGLALFVESNISILTVGTLFRSIFDKLKLPREKLAYLADSSAAPSCILFPFNAWGAYIMSLLLLQGIDRPFQLLYQSIAFNFYPFVALIIVFFTVLSGKDGWAMKKAMRRAAQEGKVIADHATPMVSSEVVSLQAKAGIKRHLFNMMIPILTMVLMMPVMLVVSGWHEVTDAHRLSFFSHAFAALSRGSGAVAVLYAVSAAVVVAMLLYKSQSLMTLREMIDLSLKGMGGMVSLAMLMVLAFAIGTLCKQLGTGLYIAEITQSWLSPALLPAIVFVSSCFVAFSTGTSWGTFAIMLAIAVPMAQSLGTPLYVAIGAALGGGVFGDHCSPISDTTIVSSMASASDHIDHVKTQVPYALLGGGITCLLYLLIG